MPSQKLVSEKARRRRIHDPVRSLANAIVALKARIEAVESRHGLPVSPYVEIFGSMEEYYNQVADEFDDIPDRDEPPLQSLKDAYERVRKFAVRTRLDPDHPLKE